MRKKRPENDGSQPDEAITTREEILDALKSIPHGMACCQGCRTLLEEQYVIMSQLQQALEAIRKVGVGGLFKALTGRG